MANGTFESQFLQGSSLRGESFTSQKAYADPSDLIQGVAQAGMTIYGEHVKNKTEKEVTEAQTDFLEGSAANREDEAKIDELRQVSPEQGAIYDQAAKDIKKLQDAINARGINPAAAQTRIDNIVAKAVAKAPFYASQIKGISGGKAAEFDAETEQMIKEVNDRRNKANDLGFNYDIPSERRQFETHLAAERNAKFVTNMTTIESAEAYADVAPEVEKYIQSSVGVIEHSIRTTGLNDMSTEEKIQYSTELQMLTNGGEMSIVEAIIRNSNVDPRFVNSEFKNSMGAMIKGRAESALKAMNGEIPKNIAANEVDLGHSKVMLHLRDNQPDLFVYTALSQYVKDTPAGTAMANVVSNDFLDMLRYTRENGVSETSMSKLKLRGFSEPKAVQRVFADATDAAMTDWMKDTDPKTLDVEAFSGSMKEHIKTINHITRNPNEYTPYVFNKQMERMNNKEFMNWFRNLDAATAETYSEGVANMMVQYARTKMSKDINNQLGKEFSGYPTRDLVTPVINEGNGAITFAPNIDTQRGESFNSVARQRAKQMNDLYASSIDLIRITGTNYGDLREPKEKTHFMRSMFTDVFAENQLPIRLEAKNLEDLRRNAMVETLGISSKEASEMSTNKLAGMVEDKFQEDAFNTRYQQMIDEAQGQFKVPGNRADSFASIVNSIKDITANKEQ